MLYRRNEHLKSTILPLKIKKINTEKKFMQDEGNRKSAWDHNCPDLSVDAKVQLREEQVIYVKCLVLRNLFGKKNRLTVDEPSRYHLNQK